MDMENILKIIAACITLLTAIITLITIIIKKHKKGETPTTSNSANGNSGTTVQLGSGSTAMFLTDSPNTQSSEQTESSEDGSREMKLAEVYTSLFAEDDKLKTERIHITKQENGVVEGSVSLQETDRRGKPQTVFTYYLVGKYANKVLTAEYYSKENRIDERGAINLKLIDSDILSGFCSFSKISASDDEIRVSPYV